MVIHPDTGALFKTYVSAELMDKMTSAEGQLYDEEHKAWYYYYSFTNPDWFVIFRVTDATLDDLTRYETDIVAWGSPSPPLSSSCSGCICATLRVPY